MESMIGKTLGQYQLIEQIGKGGMATVYKAYQPGLDRYVAVKILPAYFAHEPDFAARFTREAQAIAKLDHPHILPVYDFGKQKDISYIVMKYVPAGTLHDRLGTPMSPLEAAKIIDQVADALDSAHQRGILHRDVKPGNILIDDKDWVYLSDFGLAKMTEGSVKLTGTGVGVGTPAYMSPEQGKGLAVDARTDVYALGVILFEMLTGRVPYEAETPMAVVIKHVTDPIPLPRLVNPNIPESVERVLLKALAKDRDHRFSSAGALASALHKAVQELDPKIASMPIPPDLGATRLHVPPSAPVASVPSPGQSGTGSTPYPAPAEKGGLNWLVGIVGLAILLAGGLAIGAGWLFISSQRQTAPTEEAGALAVEPATLPAAPVQPSFTPTPVFTPTPRPSDTPTPTATFTPEPIVSPTSRVSSQSETAAQDTLAVTPVSPTPTATPTDTPTPAPRWADTGLRPDGRFADIWTALNAGNGDLGYPLANWEGDSLCAREKFERGYMLWFDRPNDTDLVWAAAVPDPAATSGATSYRFSDQWPGSPEYWCPEAQARAPLGPKRGFGMLWCIHPDLRASIGNAIEEEVGGPDYPRCEAQLFQGGAIVHQPLDAVWWVFVDRAGWYRFGE